MDSDRVLDIMGELTLLKYFPAEPAARLALVKLVVSMASDESQVKWLVQRTISVCNEWPGPLVFRQIFCSRFRPADGISAGPTEMFPEGLPSERPAPSLPALPPGASVSVDPGLERAVSILARAKDMDWPRRIAAPSIPTNPDYKPITQADIDKAMEDLRDSWARKELGLDADTQ
jgi:hypothetical protein